MKKIPTEGITYLEPLAGAEGIWFGTETPHGDLYEAEELYRDGGSLTPGRLIFVKYPSGQVTEPVKAASGQYFGDPAYYDGSVYVLLADFPAGEIRILKLDSALESVQIHASVPLSEFEDCYNLTLKTAPLMLTRQTGDTFEIVWPERRSYEIGNREAFLFRDGDELWFNRWDEEGQGETYRYWDETVVRDMDGNELRSLRGDVQIMPNGEKWLLG